MWYLIFRIIIIFFLLTIFIYSYKKHKEKIKKNVIIIFVIASGMICSLSYLIPIENLFYTFNSPQDVFKYQFKGNIYGEINGENSTMILYTTDNATYSHTVIPKYKDGWKIGTYFSYKKIIQKQYNNKMIMLYKYNESEDYYLIIYDLLSNKSDNILNIKDNKNSKFESFIKDLEVNNRTDNIYYTYINDFKEDYTLTIDDVIIELQE